MKPSREEILEELEQFWKDNPDEDELICVLADYIEQVAAEAEGVTRYEVAAEDTADERSALLDVFTIVVKAFPNLQKKDVHSLTKEVTDYFFENYTVIRTDN